MGTQVTPEGSARELLLQTHLALVQAQHERDIVAALALAMEPGAQIRLIYLHLRQDGQPVTATQVAVWGEEGPHHAASQPVSEMPLFASMQSYPDPVWFAEDLTKEVATRRYRHLRHVRSAIVIKLFGAAHVEQAPQWHALVCITWATSRTFSAQERFVCTSLWDSLCVVVSNHRLKVEALENLQRLRELDRLKTEFLHMVSHELRTPLTGILTTAEMILFSGQLTLETDLRADVETIRESGDHLLHIIQDILDMASIESGTMRLACEAVDIKAIMESAIQTVRPLAQAKRLAIELQVPSEMPLALGDGLKARQILLNLLSNAVKFSTQGTIVVSAYAEAARVVIAVRDKGIGIAPEALRTIFDPFQRIDSIHARLVSGTGLGLPISKRLVEMQGGQLWLESEPGQGSMFCFSLPIERKPHAHLAH